MSGGHDHAPGIWCDECPDAAEQRAALDAENESATTTHALTLRLNGAMYERLRRHAFDRRQSISDLIRKAVALHLAALDYAATYAPPATGPYGRAMPPPCAHGTCPVCFPPTTAPGSPS